MILLRKAISLLCIAVAVLVSSCTQSENVDTNPATKDMLTRAIPLGMQRKHVLAKLDSLKTPFTAQDTTGTVFRALVRNTSRSAIGVGHLQNLLHFDSNGALTRHEFKEVIVAP